MTIIHTEWSTGWGGQEIRIVREARGVVERGHRVMIVACPGAQILAHARAAGLPTAELAMRHGFDLRAIVGLRRIIQTEGADIVNTHSSVDSWIGAFAAKLAGAKLVRTRHLSKPLSRHPLNFVHRMPNAVMTTGEAIRRQLIEQNRLRPEKVVSVPTGVDVEYFSPGPCAVASKRALGLPLDATIVSNVAVLRDFKGHDALVIAAACLRHHADLYVLLVGEGSQRALIEQQIEDLDLPDRVRLLGQVRDIRPILSCSAVVVSSSASHEGMPQSLSQALAMARPVAATDVGSTRELIIHEQTGLLVPPDDPAALAAAIERFLHDPSFARQCGERGRAHILAHYSYERMIERVLALYESLLA